MKKVVLILFLIISASIYNNKLFAQIEFHNPDSVINFLVGKWTWISSCGGWTGTHCLYPDSLGYTKSYIFSKLDGSKDSIVYSYFKNDSLIDSKNAKISYSNSMFGDQWNLEENISGFEIGKTTLFFMSTDSIIFADNCNDCYRHEYVRVFSLSSINSRLPDNNIKIFPNPCKDFIHIDLQNYLVFKQVTFYDLNGKMIKVSQVHDGYVDISDLSQGIFFIAILKEGEWYKVKLIKE